MTRSPFFVLGCLVLAVPALGQTAQSDSQALVSLLAEVRQLRQELLATVITAQRTQILIHRLQGQEGALARAAQRFDEARERHAGAAAERKHLEGEIEQRERYVSDTQNPPAQRKAVQDRLLEEKSRLGASERQEQLERSRELEAQQQLQAEEAALDDLRDQLDRLDESLESALGARPGRAGAGPGRSTPAR